MHTDRIITLLVLILAHPLQHHTLGTGARTPETNTTLSALVREYELSGANISRVIFKWLFTFSSLF